MCSTEIVMFEKRLVTCDQTIVQFRDGKHQLEFFRPPTAKVGYR